jgi:hypothetical protein
MNEIRLGRGGVRIFRIAFGTWLLGGHWARDRRPQQVAIPRRAPLGVLLQSDEEAFVPVKGDKAGSDDTTSVHGSNRRGPGRRAAGGGELIALKARTATREARGGSLLRPHPPFLPWARRSRGNARSQPRSNLPQEISGRPIPSLFDSPPVGTAPVPQTKEVK